MSFLLRAVGFVAAPVLIATGVAAPIGLLIGAAAAGAGNAGADAIDKAKEKKQADEAAEHQKRVAQAKLDEEQRIATARAKEANDALNKKLAHEALPGQVMDACKNQQVQLIPALLKQMDDQQIRDLGLKPLAMCKTADDKKLVLKMIQTEKTARHMR